MRAKSRWERWFWMGLGFVLFAVGVVGALIPFTFHLLGAFAVLGAILVLRNSRVWRRRFIRLQRRHPRWFFPLRRLLRRKPEVWPVLWHEALRTERWLLPRGWRRLRRWRRAVRRKLGRGRRGMF